MGFNYPPSSGSGSLTAPTRSTAYNVLGTYTTTGGFGTSQQGWLFNITTSTTCAVGDTYTANSNTYTVQGALSAQTGQILFMSGTGSLAATTTLTRSTGSGSSSITFTNTGTNSLNPVATYLYTTPSGPSPLYIEVKMVGGGGSGGATSSGSIVAGNNGGSSAFGVLLYSCTGGVAPVATYAGGAGGTVNYNSSPWTGNSVALNLASITGGSGNGGTQDATSGFGVGGGGASSPFGGAGGGGGSAIAGTGAAGNSGSGGGGASTGTVTTSTAPGGGAGGYANFIITSTNLASTYIYAVGLGGAAPSSTINGGSGGSGQIHIVEHYQ
jgi:hypothetical protein